MSVEFDAICNAFIRSTSVLLITEKRHNSSMRQLLAILLFLLILTVPAHAVLPNAALKVFAVAPDGTALAAELQLKIATGTGKVWSSVSGPLVGTATQSTEKIAVKVAQNYFPDAKKYDYFFSIESNASVVDGPSAGSAMALLVVSALQEKPLPDYVALTGTITNTGEVGPVGGVFEKAHEASKNGIKLFMIPAGEARQVVKLEDGVQNVDLPEYALKEWGMKVVETATLDDVLKYAFTPPEDIDITKTPEEEETPPYIPPKIAPVKSAQVLGELNKKFITQTNEAIIDAKNALNQTLLDDAGLIEVLSRSLSSSEKTVNEAELLSQNGYYYSAGNFAFLSKVNAYFVHDVSQNPDLIDPEGDLLTEWATELKAKINAQQKILDQTVPVEGVEWYIAAQQRLTWAEQETNNLLTKPVIVVATDDAAHAQAVERVQDYEYARAWLESSIEFYHVGLTMSSKGLKSQAPFEDYYADFIENAESGLTLIQDGSGEDAQRRLDAAKLDQLKGHHLSAAMNAASALALINAILIENDTQKDIRSELETRIEELDQKVHSDPEKYAWANLYLDHAKYYLNSANYYQEQSQGTAAASNLSSGLSLVLLAENTFEITKDIQKYYEDLPDSRFSSLAGISSGEGINTTPGNGTVIPLPIGPDGTGSITVTSPDQPPFTGILAAAAVVLVVVLAGIVIVGRGQRTLDQPLSKAGASLSGSRSLQMVDELEARLFAAKQGLRHAQHQYSTNSLSKEAFDEVSRHYTEQIRSTSKELRKANVTLRSHERNGSNKNNVREETLSAQGIEPKIGSKKVWPTKKKSVGKKAPKKK